MTLKYGALLSSTAVRLLDSPKDCSVETPGCGKQISIWVKGMLGECFHPDAGFKFGKGGASTVQLEVSSDRCYPI